MSLAFDRISACYDDISPLPAHVLEALAGAMIASVRAKPGSCFLDVGVGTGRITIPIARQGYSCIGLDLSTRMMMQLRDKDPQGLVRLVRGDMTCLPFAACSFDAVMAVHVFHLVAQWRLALAEVRRVLRPGGLLLHTLPDKPSTSPTGMAREQWQRIVHELGGHPNHPGAQSGAEVHAALEQMGADTWDEDVVSWRVTLSPRDILRRTETDHHVRATGLDHGLFAQASRRYEAWLLAHFGALDGELEEERHAILTVARFPS